ncbi:hypothetical protein EXIGLDRAFT_691109 [Exidia glandulosa HHB12029]|uniref:Uncharacterized protein n=1 Tax=Exidia glandulosa HHB12029 TaxID=1314781 RepID=A0A165IV93_EXIGL|nr:hypothetical protein EXIGLDRAFT_691109 [Exidia glandulosa HHB12029]
MPSGGTLFPDPLETTTLAFRVAREAVDAVPIVKQILGAAVHISEFAEKVKKKRESMNELVEKVNIYAAQIGAMVADRAASEQTDGHIHHRLQRLYAVFMKVETFISSQASTANPAFRWLRNNFVAPNTAEKLSRELQREVELFQIMIAVDIRFTLGDVTRNVASDSLYDGEFRRLRYCDVHKLATIAQTREACLTVTWARAEVDGKLMVVRYETLTRGDAVPDGVGALFPRATYLEVIKSISLTSQCRSTVWDQPPIELNV